MLKGLIKQCHPLMLKCDQYNSVITIHAHNLLSMLPKYRISKMPPCSAMPVTYPNYEVPSHLKLVDENVPGLLVVSSTR